MKEKRKPKENEEEKRKKKKCENIRKKTAFQVASHILSALQCSAFDVFIHLDYE